MTGGCEIIGHGISVSRMITGNMTEQQERDYIRESLDALTRATGEGPYGMDGAGVRRVGAHAPACWPRLASATCATGPTTSSPTRSRFPPGELFALPVMLELDDVIAMAHRKVTVDRYATMLRESFDGMYGDGSDNGRSMVLSLHPLAHRAALPHRLSGRRAGPHAPAARRLARLRRRGHRLVQQQPPSGVKSAGAKWS